MGREAAPKWLVSSIIFKLVPELQHSNSALLSQQSVKNRAAEAWRMVRTRKCCMQNVLISPGGSQFSSLARKTLRLIRHSRKHTLCWVLKNILRFQFTNATKITNHLILQDHSECSIEKESWTCVFYEGRLNWRKRWSSCCVAHSSVF